MTGYETWDHIDINHRFVCVYVYIYRYIDIYLYISVVCYISLNM